MNKKQRDSWFIEAKIMLVFFMLMAIIAGVIGNTNIMIFSCTFILVIVLTIRLDIERSLLINYWEYLENKQNKR